MQFSFIKSLLEESLWMIHPGTASAYYPLLKGVFSGLQFVSEPEPENSIPFLVSVSSSNVIPFSNPNDLYYASDDDQYVFVLNMRGTMLKHDAECGPRGTRTLASRLSKMDQKANVIGHIIVTESGGGMAASVPEMADAIQALTKPVVAWIDGMSASAAYYINSYCSHIMASRATDEVGCIGTLVQLQGFPKYSKLENGLVVARIYADAASEKNDEYEAALEGNFTLIKERSLNPHNEQFIADVKSNRPNVKDDQLKGRTYNAGDVVGTLIDSIGTFNDAVNLVISLAKPASQPTGNNQNSNNTKKMEGLENLNKIQSVNGLELVDGHASLNEEQLTDIEQELANGVQATERVTELEGENSTLTATVAKRDARITELEAALEAARGDNADDSAVIKRDTDGGGTDVPEDSFAAAKSFCENHLKKVK
ncbi:MAG: S49 family peptidase [Bacteroidales bacterium]